MEVTTAGWSQAYAKGFLFPVSFLSTVGDPSGSDLQLRKSSSLFVLGRGHHELIAIQGIIGCLLEVLASL